jgi:hypothetical protein
LSPDNGQPAHKNGHVIFAILTMISLQENTVVSFLQYLREGVS